MALTNPNQPAWTPLDSGGQLAVADAGATVDNVFIFTSAESPTGKVRRVINGSYSASWAGVFTGGVAATNASRLNIILSNAAVKEVIFDDPSGGDIPLSGTITASNKVFTFTGDFAFTGTYTINNIAIDASYNQVLFKGTPTIVAPQTVSGKFSSKWWGVVSDGSDVSAKLNLCASSVATSFQKSIIFPGSSSVYLNTGAVSIPSNISLCFENGAVLDTTSGSVSGGVIDASLYQQIFTVNSAVNPQGWAGSYPSVKWFGAVGSGSVNDQPSIQSCVDMINRNRTTMTVCYFPGGAYRIDDPINCSLYNTASQRYEQTYIFLKGEGQGYSSKFPAKGTRIIANFKNRPAVWWQIGKSGGAESLSIEGQFVSPTMTAAEFYNSELADYTDPTCRDTRYSPYCGIAVDAVKYTGAPADGGYPGFNYTAPGNISSSGSSGLVFKDLKIRGFTVCMAFSPNGQTQNDDCISVSSIKIEDCKVGFASCQDQEKGNVFEKIVSWGVCHTVFDNQTYGSGTSGHIVVNEVNLAARNNQFINWGSGGRFPCMLSNIYSETLGKFGTLTTAACQIVVSNSILRWAPPSERGGYYANWHINSTRGVLFQGCSFIIYGQFVPTIIATGGINSSGPTFRDCYFDAIPSQWAEQARGGAIFDGCYTNGEYKFGGSENINANVDSIKNWLTYGNYTINDIAVNPTNQTAGRKEITLSGNFLYRQVATAIGAAVAIQPDRSAVITLAATSSTYFHKVNTPVYFGTAFAGLVDSVDSVAGTLTVKNINKSIVDGNYNVNAMCPATMYGFIGNVTNSSNTILLARSNNDIGVSVGDVIYHAVFGASGCAVVTNISGSLTTGATLTMSLNAARTATGIYFSAPGITKKFINPSFNTIGGTFAATTIIPQGSITESYQFGYKQTFLATNSGFINAVSASDTRQVEFSCTSLPTIIDRFFPGDVGKPANGSTTYQNEYFKGIGYADFVVLFGGVELYPNIATQLSYTLNNTTGVLTITNGTFDSSISVVIKGR